MHATYLFCATQFLSDTILVYRRRYILSCKRNLYVWLPSLIPPKAIRYVHFRHCHVKFLPEKCFSRHTRCILSYMPSSYFGASFYLTPERVFFLYFLSTLLRRLLCDEANNKIDALIMHSLKANWSWVFHFRQTIIKTLWYVPRDKVNSWKASDCRSHMLLGRNNLLALCLQFSLFYISRVHVTRARVRTRAYVGSFCT